MSEKLSALREKYPQYQDVDDDTLADALYNKHYSDRLSRKEFEVHLGRDPISQRFAESPTPGLSSFVDYAVNPFGVKDEIDWVGGYVRGLVESDFDTEAAAKEADEAMEWRRAYDKVKGEQLGIVPRLVGDVASIATNPQAALPSFATRIAQGVGLGAAYGAGESEGGVEERLGGAATGGAFGAGAALGIEAVRPVAGVLAKYGGKAGRYARDVAGDVIPGAKRNTDARLLRALEHSQLTPEEALARYEQGQAATRLGGARSELPESIADLGQGTQRLSQAVFTAGGRGASVAKEALEGRARTQFGRVMEDVAQAFRIKSAKDFLKTRNSLIDEQKALSTPAYNAAFENSQPINIGNTILKWEMAATREAGKIRDSLEEAIKLFRNKYARGRARGRESLVTLRQFDAAKRALDDKIGEAKRAGRNAEVRMLTEFKNDVLQRADEASTVLTSEGPKSLYAEARKVYSSRAELIDALEEGRKAFRGDVDVNADLFRRMSPAEQRMFKIGVAREIRKKLGEKRLGNDMASFFDTPNRQELLDVLMGRGKGRANFDELMQREQGMIETRNITTRGSQTAMREAALDDFNMMTRLGRTFQEQGVIGAVFNAVGEWLQQALRMREQDAYQIAKLLYETNENEVRKILNRMIRKYGAQKVRQASQAAIAKAMQFRTGAGASASIGGQFGEVQEGRLPAPEPE